MEGKITKPAEKEYSFNDVLIVPNYCGFWLEKIILNTKLTKNIEINIPIVSAAMDTVTEVHTAIALARLGGIGFIHRNMSIEEQCIQVQKGKRFTTHGMVVDPIRVGPDLTIKEVKVIAQENNCNSFIVTTTEGAVIGMLTSRDRKFCRDENKFVSEFMTKNPIIIDEEIAESNIEAAWEILAQNRIEQAPVVDKKGVLKGLFTLKDYENQEKYPNASKDKKGRLRIGAAVGVGWDTVDRVEALLNVGVDVITVDVSHAHTWNVVEATKDLKKRFGNLELIVGNVVTYEAAKALEDAGADAVKVGIGPGSICTTRIVTGGGRPQISAIIDCAKIDIPLIADGGIKYSGDIAKAIAAGARSVMIGSLFAGTEESPGKMELFQGRAYKSIRGMGSVDVIAEGRSGDRYMSSEKTSESEIVPEGIVGRVPFRGKLSDVLYQLVGGLKKGMGLAGCRSVEEMICKTKLAPISSAGLEESHVHNVEITKEAPNYSKA